MHPIAVYLAGPDVFAPDPRALFARRARLCAGLGLRAITPLDPFDDPPQWESLPPWHRIARRNEARIAAAAAVIANLSPFRGPSADAGTIYEIGFARGLGRPVFAYSIDSAGLLARSLGQVGADARRDGAAWRDRDGMELEDFGCRDNLMIDGAVADAGAWLADQDADADTLFARVAALCASALREKGPTC